MLHRSFKPAKCKTALKLAASRIKLLKNKREAQVKQLKRELAKLLESGQEQTARIRVEHVVREEKTMAAYDLIEIYCELIVARLPIIESQKNCPIDLKEAIASIIFASPRCADIPELMDARKHFTSKYGKEFTSAAVELRPDCGVSRLMVEKLSAKAPDGQTKIKILSAIAEEHNIRWDPNSFGDKDSKPPEDLLSGPNTFEKASNIFVDTPSDQAPHDSDKKGPPNVQVPSKSDEKHDVPEHNAKSSHNTQFASTDIGTNKMMSSGPYCPEVRPSRTGSEGVEFRQSYYGDEKAFSLGRQNWNMEFKDAASAAQAAAESAERASMAARAAAELSSREKMTRQYSTESQKSSGYGFGDEAPQNYTGSVLPSKHHAKDPLNNIFHRKNSRMQHVQTEGDEQDDMAGVAGKFYSDDLNSANKSSQSATLKSSTSSFDDDPLVNNLQMADRYSRNKSSEVKPSDLTGEVSRKETTSKSDLEFVSKLQDGKNSDNSDYVEESRIRKQSSKAFSHSRSSTYNDDHNSLLNLNYQRSENDDDENPFAVNIEGNVQTNMKETNSHENTSVVFDNSGSDDDDCKFDVEGEHKDQEYSLDSSSLGRESPTHLFANTNAWGHRQSVDESTENFFSQSHLSVERHSTPVFSESSTSSVVPLQSDDLFHATFDDSDGPCSESEEELDKSKFAGSVDPSVFPPKQNVYSSIPEPIQVENHEFKGSTFAEEENVDSGNPWLKSPSDPVKVRPAGIKGINVSAEHGKSFGYGDLPTSQSSRLSRSWLNSNDMDSNSCNNPASEGNHQQSQQPVVHEVKDNVHTPQVTDIMKDNEVLKESSSESGKELNFETLTGGLRHKGYRLPAYMKSSPGNVSLSKKEAGDAYTKIEQSFSSPSVKASISSGAHSQNPYNQRVSTEANKKSSTRTPVAHCDSDDDSDKVLPQMTFRSGQVRYNQQAVAEENSKSSSRGSVIYFESDSDSEEDFPKQTSTSNALSRTGFSRRTKVSPTSSDRSSYSRTTVSSGASVTPDHATETRLRHQLQNKISDNKGSSDRSSYSRTTVSSGASVTPDHATETRLRHQLQNKISDNKGSSDPSSYSRTTVSSGASVTPDHATETRLRCQPQNKISDNKGSSEQSRLVEQAPFKPSGSSFKPSGSKRSLREESSKASEREQRSNSLSKTALPGRAESLKTSSSSGQNTSGERASHVHPKLPDYDTITAQLQSLRRNQ